MGKEQQRGLCPFLRPFPPTQKLLRRGEPEITHAIHSMICVQWDGVPLITDHIAQCFLLLNSKQSFITSAALSHFPSSSCPWGVIVKPKFGAESNVSSLRPGHELGVNWPVIGYRFGRFCLRHYPTQI